MRKGNQASFRNASHRDCPLSINNCFHCHSTHVYIGRKTSGSRKKHQLQGWPQWGFRVTAGKPFWITNTSVQHHYCSVSTCVPSCADLRFPFPSPDRNQSLRSHSPQRASQSHQEACEGYFNWLESHTGTASERTSSLQASPKKISSIICLTSSSSH